jgi:hypothetical protein
MSNSSVWDLPFLLVTCLACVSILNIMAINFFRNVSELVTTLDQVPEDIVNIVIIRNITSKELYAERNNYRFTGFFTSSFIRYSSQHNVSETGSVSVLR